MKTISIIGCGFISKKWIKAISELDNCQLYSVYDNNRNQLNSIAEYIDENKFSNQHLKYYNLEKDFFDNVGDILIISTPTYLHFKHTVNSAVEIGKTINSCKNIIIEKPISNTTLNASNALSIAEDYKVRLFGVNQRRFSPYVQQAKKLIKKLKNPYLIQCNVLWNRNEDYFNKSIINQKKEFCYGMLYNQMYHFIDIVRWFGGELKDIKTLEVPVAVKGKKL